MTVEPGTAEPGSTVSAQPRRLFMVLSPRALGYGRYALESLFRNALEPFHLHLITDSAGDRDLLAQEVAKYQHSGQNLWNAYAKDDLRDREAAIFAPYPNLRRFRDGHPCWRKITDPVLLSAPGEEMVMLDPDLYFPNRFCFEKTLDQGLLLMWQKPNCLFPPEIVTSALESKIPLARHVDIGVGHWRAPVDLEWLEWLIGKLGGEALPLAMHIEAIVWAAVAMRVGGGYLAPRSWHCWHRTQRKRLLRKAGIPGARILRSEPFSTIKCFHAGGEAKSWLGPAQNRGWIHGGNTLSHMEPVLPYIELSFGVYHREQRMKGFLKTLGYYRIFQSQ